MGCYCLVLLYGFWYFSWVNALLYSVTFFIVYFFFTSCCTYYIFLSPLNHLSFVCVMVLVVLFVFYNYLFDFFLFFFFCICCFIFFYFFFFSTLSFLSFCFFFLLTRPPPDSNIFPYPPAFPFYLRGGAPPVSPFPSFSWPPPGRIPRASH